MVTRFQQALRSLRIYNIRRRKLRHAADSEADQVSPGTLDFSKPEQSGLLAFIEDI